jgi:hypothetical protein
MVTAARYIDPAEAQMARSALEAAGIRCFLQGETANSLIPVAFRARLLVPEEEEARAREVLENAEFKPFTEAEVTAAEIADEAARAR